MGSLDKILGRDDPVQPQKSPSPGHASRSSDDQAIVRYRYMLQTAPPQALEQAHTEAFSKLTPQQRTLLLQQLSAELPEAERSAHVGGPRDDPQSLARMATRAELRQPGTLERSFNAIDARVGGMGGMLAGSFLASMAGVVIGSAIAQSAFGDAGSGDMADASDAAGDGDFELGGFDEF